MINNFINLESKYKFLIFITFHIILSACFTLISYSNLLSHLHDQQGIWYFARDSYLYHAEAIILKDYLANNDFYNFFNSFNNHFNVKIISFFYYIFGIDKPFVYIPFNSILWSTSILLVFNTVKKISSSKVVIILCIIPFFYFSYLTIYMVILRDSLYILGFVIRYCKQLIAL